MLRQALKLVEQELNHYITQHETSSKAYLDNIALLDSADAALKEGIVITLVNVEEERTLKNIPAYTTSPTTGRLEYSNPPLHLNLYLLFTANFSNYEMGLEMLGLTMRFFQGKSTFSIQNTVNTTLSSEELAKLRLIFNIYTLTFEQLNHLWGSLGGKQLPHVMYRVWLVEEKDKQPIRSGDLITDVEGDLSARGAN